MATTIKGRGQITIVDLNDAKQVQVVLENNMADVQLYNPDTKVYTPNISSSNSMIITPKVYVTGSSKNNISDCSSIAWTVNGTEYTSSSSSTDYVVDSSTGALTINTNISGNSLILKFTATYADPTNTSLTTQLEAYKTITKSSSAGALFQTVITAPNGTTFDTSQSTDALTAEARSYRGGTQDTTGTTYKWYKLGSDGTWTQITKTASGTGVTAWVTTGSGGVSTLHVTADDVLNFQNYKVTASDTENSTASTSESVITFFDVTDPYTVECYSLAGTTLRNGDGQTDIRARVWQNGTIVEDSASTLFTYTWTKYDSTGTAANWYGTSSSTKTGNPLTVFAAEVSGTANFICEIAEKTS